MKKCLCVKITHLKIRVTVLLRIMEWKLKESFDAERKDVDGRKRGPW